MSDRPQNKPSFFTRKTIIVTLLFTNVVTVFLLLNIQYNISKVKKQRQREVAAQDTLQYDDNPVYIEQTQLFDIYKTHKANIVMLGSSFTQRVNWNELLERNDVANRGIGSDVSEGYLHRLRNVLSLQPRICFLELGANDIIRGVPLDTIVENTFTIIYLLNAYKVDVVLTRCFLNAGHYPGYEMYNLKADSLNTKFDKKEREWGIDVTTIDINPQISAQNKRRSEYALADGIHLNAKAYVIWKKEIEKVLQQKQLLRP